MNLNFRGIDAKTAAKIHSYRVEHGLNLNQAPEAIIEEWHHEKMNFLYRIVKCKGFYP